ncbi:MAG: HDIG domain-containing protein [Opitutales bacterium]|nr:HDIG domain-containing protein [Opitutales bacterium]
MTEGSIWSMFWSAVVRFFNRPWVAILFFGALISLVAFWNRPPHAPVISRGSNATFSYRAPYAFEYSSEILRERKAAEAAAKVKPVYSIDNRAEKAALKAFQMIAGDIVEDYDVLKPLSQEEIAKEITKILGFSEIELYLKEQHLVPEKDFPENLSFIIQYSSDANIAKEWVNASCEIYERLAKEGISPNDIAIANIDNVSQFNRDFENALEDALVRDVYGYTETRQNLRRNVRATIGMFSSIGLMDSNLVFDLEQTNEAKSKAKDAVPRQTISVAEGEALLVADELVTDEIYERWQAFRQEMTKRQASYVGGSKNFLPNAFFVLLVTLAAVLAGRLLLPEFFKKRGISSPIVCAGVLMFFNVLAVRLVLEVMDSTILDVVLPNSQVAEAWLSTTPIFSALVCALIAGAPLAIVSSGFLCAIIALMLDGSAEIFFPAFAVSLIVVYWSKRIAKRTQLLVCAFYAGLLVALILLFVWLYVKGSFFADCIFAGDFFVLFSSFKDFSINIVGVLIMALILGSLAAALITPIERMFGLTSNITLSELTDFNHPLLRSLQSFAPGTYNHSVTVSSYAANAASRIGANAVLCRCAGLYHDIGKIERAYFFTENQVPGTENPHNKLTPEISATIIRRHVKAGLVKADEYHLPLCVKELIQQHHGRSYVGYFLKKAKDLAVSTGGEEAAVDLEKFRYDGPSPRTKEAVVLLCSDVVEAASRSLRDPSPARLESLVNKLIDERLQEGEFEESQITMRDLAQIKKSLIESITEANHRRISYSQDEVKREVAHYLEKGKK